MSSALRRAVYRLKVDAAPVIAARERSRRQYEESQPRRAKVHLLRVVAVHRYGDPQIDERLAHAYDRALKKLGFDRFAPPAWNEVRTEHQALEKLETTLTEEHPDRDFNARVAEVVKEIPDWLLLFTRAAGSGVVLGLEVPHAPDALHGLVPDNVEDQDAWPDLPKGMLTRLHPADLGFLNSLSPAEKDAFRVLADKPEKDCTRREIRFMRGLCRDAERQKRHSSE